MVRKGIPAVDGQSATLPRTLMSGSLCLTHVGKGILLHMSQYALFTSTVHALLRLSPSAVEGRKKSTGLRDVTANVVENAWVQSLH